MVPVVPGPGTMPGFGAPATACVAPTYATAGSVAPPAKYTGPDPALRFTCRRGSFLPATGGCTGAAPAPGCTVPECATDAATRHPAATSGMTTAAVRPNVLFIASSFGFEPQGARQHGPLFKAN